MDFAESFRRLLNFPNKEHKLMPALPIYLIEPIWEQFAALLPTRKVDHPLGCHRRRGYPTG